MIAAVSGRFRDRASAQEGAISASALIGIGLLLLLGYLVLALFQGDSAQFGTVAVPGSGRVELPKGDIDVYYSEGVDPDSDVELVAPPDLRVTVAAPNGTGVQVAARGSDPESTDDGMTRLIGSLRAPEDAVYTVTTESTQAGQRITPAVTFGQGPFAAVGKRFESVVDALRGPLGIALVLVLVFLFFLPRIQAARRRASYRGR
jgi:hypothetical protein